MRAQFGFKFPVPISDTFPNAAKCAARMAQLLSTTHVGQLETDPRWIELEEPDVLIDSRTGAKPAHGCEKTEHVHNFSDGCSTMSVQALEELKLAIP